MRVLWFAPHFRLGESMGSLRTWQLAKALAEAGCEIAVVLPRFDPLTERRSRGSRAWLWGKRRVNDVELIETATTRNDRSRFVARFFYFVSHSLTALIAGLAQPRPRLVIAANLPFFSGISALVVARIKRAPFVFEVRDLSVEAAVASGYMREGTATKLARAMQRFLCRRADAVITVSPGMKRYVCALGVEDRRVTVVPNGYEDELFEQIDWTRDARAEMGWGDRCVVLYAGALGFIQDVSTLLRCAERLRDRAEILFVIIGSGQREQEYRRFCDDRDLHNCVFLGGMPRREIPLLCSAADICVNLFGAHPLWGVMLGNKNFDYMGSGTCCLYAGPEDGDSARLIREAGAGVAVAAEDPGELAAAILELSSDPARREEMGQAGREYVLANYSRRDIAADFVALVSRLVEEHG